MVRTSHSHGCDHMILLLPQWHVSALAGEVRCGDVQRNSKKASFAARRPVTLRHESSCCVLGGKVEKPMSRH